MKVFALWALSCAVAGGMGYTIEPRIVGGKNSKGKSWIVSLHSRDMGNSHFCGGILVHKEWIVSAGHCLDDLTDEYTAYIGGATLSVKTQFDIVKIDKIRIHPNYNFDTDENDIAMAHLVRSSKKSPAKLNTNAKNEATGKTLYVAGWGVTSSKSTTFQNTLKEVKLPVAKQSICKSTMGFPAGTNSTVCAGFKKGGADSCLGDSGGPLYTNNTVVGIASFGEDCAKPNLYGVYTRISHYSQWIKDVIEGKQPEEEEDVEAETAEDWDEFDDWIDYEDFFKVTS